MKLAPKPYLLDANVLIEAHQRYYGLDICPGFWDFLVSSYDQADLHSIDKVKAEISEGDALHDWVGALPAGFFASTVDDGVAHHFAKMMNWVARHDRYTQAAKAEFASAADGWLAAYAKTHDCVVVTHEVHRPEQKKGVPLGTVCKEFGVPYVNTFSMLRTLKAEFSWKK